MLKSIQLLLMLGCLAVLGACEKQDPEILLQEARAKMNEQAYPEAIALLDQIIAIDSKNADAFNMRGVANISIDELPFAVIDFEKAIAIDSTNYKYYYNMGNVKRDIQQTVAAIDDYSKAISLDSNVYAIWFNRAICYASTKKETEALADFEQAIQRGGEKDTQLRIYQGQVLMNLERYEEAEMAFNACIGIQNNHAEGYYRLALAQLKMEKNKDEACQNFKKAFDFGYQEAEHAMEDHCQ